MPYNGIVPPESDRPRPTAVGAVRAEQLRREWDEITERWLAQANSKQIDGWSETFYPSPAP